MASSSTPARRRRGGFGRFFLIWCLALALIGVLVLAKLWHSLSQYEKNSPEAAVTDFLQNIASADEEQLLQGSEIIELPFPYADLADYLAVDRTSMMKEIGKMKKEGLLAGKNHRLTLLF